MKRVFVLLGCLLACSTASAHVLTGGGGFYSGLRHPVLGFDHFLAMISVGVISAQMGKRHIWFVPGTFVLAMLVGGVWGMHHEWVRPVYVEKGIAFSVCALGFAIAAFRQGGTTFIYLCVAFFGMLHGIAHGYEVPIIASPRRYCAGFVLGTTLIHIAGVIIGHFSQRNERLTTALRHLGSAVGGIGAYILLFV